MTFLSLGSKPQLSTALGFEPRLSALSSRLSALNCSQLSTLSLELSALSRRLETDSLNNLFTMDVEVQESNGTMFEFRFDSSMVCMDAMSPTEHPRDFILMPTSPTEIVDEEITFDIDEETTVLTTDISQAPDEAPTTLFDTLRRHLAAMVPKSEGMTYDEAMAAAAAASPRDPTLSPPKSHINFDIPQRHFSDDFTDHPRLTIHPDAVVHPILDAEVSDEHPKQTIIERRSL